MSDKVFNDILDFSTRHNSLLRYPNGVDFKELIRGAAQNEVWRDTTSETLWDILSACGKDINNIVTSNAIDYVQNLGDLNTARIPALVSMGEMLKYETGSLLEIYNAFPSGLQLMLDVLSIDREYLFGGESPILSIPLVRKLTEKMKLALMHTVGRTWKEETALQDVVAEVKINEHRLDEEGYYALIKEIYYEMILDVLGATYSESDGTTLIDNLLYAELQSYERQDSVPRNTILDRMIKGESRHPLDMESTVGSSITLDPSIQVAQGEEYSSLAQQVEALRRTYNVSISFDPWEIAAQVNEHGLSPGNELTENEKILVETILNAHNKERFDYASGKYLLGKIDTRYGYYRELEFVKYLKAFIILHSLKVQAVNLDVTTLNLVNINVIEKKDTCVLDLFTYVNKEWEYDPTEVEDTKVDEYGVGRAMVNKPIDFVNKKMFIPRVLGDMQQVAIEKYGYDCMEEYGNLGSRTIALEKTKPTDILEIIADKLTELTFKIHAMRNEMKRQAQFNAMRGTGSLLAHSINDFLLTKYPTEQFEVIPRWSSAKAYTDRMKEIAENWNENTPTELDELRFRIDENVKLFRNYTNVDIIEYMDTTEYFNIHPTGLYTNDEVLLDTRYWEQLSKAITNRDKAQLGVFSPNDIHEFYRNRLSMGSLHSSTEVVDDIEEFLLSLYETGATDTHYDAENQELVHPINDIANEDNLFAYESKPDRMKVQDNEDLIEKQNKQFLRYSADTNMLGENRNRNGNGQVIEAFNWKNTKYASVMLHPFMYTFQLWNPLVNIIINAMSEYITSDLEKSITNKKIFDELYGELGESKNFWKYNVLDLTGYVTRYEHEKHDKTDAVGETSPLTGYDGLFYPSAIQEFIDAYRRTEWEKNKYAEWDGVNNVDAPRRVLDFTPRFDPAIVDAPISDESLTKETRFKSIFVSSDMTPEQKREAYSAMAFDRNRYVKKIDDEFQPEEVNLPPEQGESFEQVIASIYWQIEFTRPDVNSIQDLDTAKNMTYYGRWFSHLGYSDERCKRIAKQLWYWRDRIVDAATHRYAVCNYNLDLGNNSMFLMDTFTNELPSEDDERNLVIEALDASLNATNNFIERTVNSNNNTTAGRCFTPSNRPKELWIRWNAEPIAMPAFDVWWNNEKLPDRWYDESSQGTAAGNATSLGSAGKLQEFGQIKYKDSSTNDALNDAIENFLKIYSLDGSGIDMVKGNKAPIFYSFQQNSDVIVFSTWRRISGDDSSLLNNYDRTDHCPIHILCKETQSSNGEYAFERFLQDTPSIDPIGKTQYDSYLSAPYVFDSTGGNIFIPVYRIETPRPTLDETNPSDLENGTVLSGQNIFIKLYGLACQSLVKNNYETRERLMMYDERCISINADNLFAGSVLISNGTSVLFSLDGEKLGLAFLGNLTQQSQDIVSKTLANGCTRYLADSDPQEKIALLRKRFYEVKGEVDEEVDNKEIGTYADLRISDDEGNIWNSFDRNDKFVCVVQYDGALNPGTWSLEAKNSSKFSSRLLNLVSDASYIPEFAYQSPKDFERFPEVSGTTQLFKSTYFGLKDHWAIQLLGLENNLMLDFVKVARDLIVHDETDNVDTYVNPGQVVDAIYRIWEQSEMTDENLGIDRLYNPRMEFDESGVATWVESWVVNEEGKDEFLNRNLTIVRCNENKDGEVLNEKNWILKTLQVKDVVEDLSKQNPSGDGFRKVSLDDFYTEALVIGREPPKEDGTPGRIISANCKSTSHILVGTQDPYKYSADPDWATTLRSPAYLLQYGNGIAGARRCEVGVFIDKRKEDEELPQKTEGEKPWPSREEAPYLIRIEVKLFKDDADVRSRETEELSAYMDSITVIPPKCMLMAVSQDEVSRLVDYHMLVHHNDIFYNVPNPDKDDILRADLVPNVEESTHFVCPKCGYVYDESKGSPWAILEPTSISSNVLSATFIKPTLSSIKCVWEVKDFQQGTAPATLYLEYGTSQGTYEVTKEIATCTNKLAGKVMIYGLHSDTMYYARLRLTQGEGEDSTDIDKATGSFITAKPDIPAGTKFADVPVDWKCPKCATPKSKFKPLVDPESTGIAEDQNRSRLQANKPARNFLDYLYIYEGSAAFKINEQSDRFCTFQWEHPTPELDKLLYNFRKNQVDLNCLYPWSTYVTQEHNPKLPHVSSVEMQATAGSDCRGKEELAGIANRLDALVVDVQQVKIDENGMALPKPSQQTYDVAIWMDSTGSMDDEIDQLKLSVEELCDKIIEKNPNNKIAFVQFGDRGYSYTGTGSNQKRRVMDFTNDAEVIRQHINGLIGRYQGSWGDENLWSVTKLVTLSNLNGGNMLNWRPDSKKIVIAISDEAVDNYTPVMARLATATIDGEPVTDSSQFDSADWSFKSVVNSSNRSQVRNQYNWGYDQPGTPLRDPPHANYNSTYGGLHWMGGYDATKVNPTTFQKVFNDHDIQFYYIETQDKSITGEEPTPYGGGFLQSQQQVVDWIYTYVYRIQKDLLDGITAGGYSYSIYPNQLVATLKEVFDHAFAAPATWEYEIQPGDTEADILEKLYKDGYVIHTWEDEGVNEDGTGSVKSIDVSGDDFDSTYKIYANYQRIEDPDDPRGYHFDLFFNIQNLFKPPFEYISKVTHQPAPLVLPNSYLYLPGDKASRLQCSGGKLTLYAQMKWLVNDIATSVKTLPLITYDIYNISDDKPKFFLKRSNELERTRPTLPTVFIKFEDVYLDGSEFVDENGITNKDINVIQAMSVHYNNDVASQYNRLNKLKFNIVQNNSVNVGSNERPPYIDVLETKKFFRIPPETDGGLEMYPERFNDMYSTMGVETKGYSVSYSYQDEGYTNEDLYLYWCIPAGINVVNAIQKLGCLVEDTAVKCSAKMKSGDEARVIAIPGHIYVDSISKKVKYLGQEHGKNLNKFGYVLTNVGSSLRNKVRLTK